MDAITAKKQKCSSENLSIFCIEMNRLTVKHQY